MDGIEQGTSINGNGNLTTKPIETVLDGIEQDTDIQAEQNGNGNLTTKPIETVSDGIEQDKDIQVEQNGNGTATTNTIETVSDGIEQGTSINGNGNLTTKPIETVIETVSDGIEQDTGIQVEENGNGTVTTKTIETVSDGIEKDTSIQVEGSDVLPAVNNRQYVEMRNLLSKKVEDIREQQASLTRAGFYSKHKWTCYVRDRLAEMMPRTEMHNLIAKFTEPLDLDNTRMYESFREID